MAGIAGRDRDAAASARAPGDLRLVERAAGGDREAFEDLVVARVERIFRTALAILGRESDASDVVQETFIAVWVELPRLRQPDRFDAWVGRILVNNCRMALRRRGRVREIHMSDEAVGHPQFASSATDLAEIDVLDRAFGRLRHDDRALLVMRYLDDRSVREIADVLGIPEGTVKSRLHRARQALQAGVGAENR